MGALAVFDDGKGGTGHGLMELDDWGTVDDRRRFRRAELSLPGRYMLPDRREFECTVRDISPAGVSIIGPECGEIGDRIVAYVAQIGRLEGILTRTFDDGFAIQFNITDFKREKLSKMLSWLEKKEELGHEQQRTHTRFVPEQRGSNFVLPDGRSYPCEVIDMSLSGASIKVSVIPGIGTPVHLGKMRGTVVRHHPEGVAIRFSDVPDLGTLCDHFGGKTVPA